MRDPRESKAGPVGGYFLGFFFACVKIRCRGSSQTVFRSEFFDGVFPFFNLYFHQSTGRSEKFFCIELPDLCPSVS